MKTTRVKLPPTSILSGRDYHYADSYQGSFQDPENRISSQDIGKAFFMAAPAWTARLFDLRNKIVSVFGLKTPNKEENQQALFDSFRCEPNERLGLFKVYSRSENEVVLGEDDSHLNFRVSLLKQDTAQQEGVKHLTVSTTVEFNNWVGRLYFLPVKPFHKLIVPTMLKGIIRQLEHTPS